MPYKFNADRRDKIPKQRCHCTLINQILRFQGILEQFCTLNCNISTGCSLQDLTPFERFQISSARIRSA